MPEKRFTGRSAAVIFGYVQQAFWYFHMQEVQPTMTDVALIYPYQYKHARNAMLFHPLGIAQLSAVLRKKGFATLVLDATFRDFDEVQGEIQHAKPRIVGIYVMLTMTENARMLAKKLRELVPGLLLVCGGPMPTLRPEQFSTEFDLVFRGEASESFPGFCGDYLSSGSLTDILDHRHRYPGIFFQKPGTDTVIGSPPRSHTERELNRLPIPDLSDYDHSRYQQFWEKRENFRPACIMTTYGCPYACDFCSKPVFGRYFRRRQMDRIMEEIHNIRSQGYDGLWIADDCFTLDPDHVRLFCDRMIREQPGMRWSCLSRTDRITGNQVELMRRAGCKKVFFGLESGSDEVLRIMNKKMSVSVAERTVRLFAGSGIETAGFFMVGYPGETIETIEQTFAWALSLPLDEISFTIPFPLPDTSLYRRVYGVQPDREWRYENENRIIYNSEFDEAHLNRRINETYEQFNARKAC